ncbi:MAG: ABC transporter permease [Bacilli bacterium]
MYFIKRSFIYVKRKFTKIIQMAAIFFIVASLVLSGFLIKSVAKSTYDVARAKLGATVNYNANYRNEMIKDTENNNQGPMNREDFVIPDDYTEITTSEIDTIVSNSKYVTNYNVTTSVSGNFTELEYYNPYEEESSNENNQNFGNMPGDLNRVRPTISIIGANYEKNDTIFVDNGGTIIDGRYFTDEEIKNGNNVIILESTIAELNDLVVGDTISITATSNSFEKSTTNSLEVEYTIVGIYETSNPVDLTDDNNIFANTTSLSENTLYVPYINAAIVSNATSNGTTIDKSKEIYESEGLTVTSVEFILNDPENVDAFIEEVNAIESLDLTYRQLDTNNAEYEQMVAPIENVAKTSSGIIIFIVIASVIVLCLITTLMIKTRRFEFGVLLSLGESKIIMQLMVEMLFTAFIGFALAIIFSTYTAKAISNYLINNEITVTEEKNTQTNNKPGGMGDFGGMMSRNDTSNLDVEVIDTLDIKLDVQSIVYLYIIGSLIVIVTNIISASNILKLKPKEILLER